MTMRRVYPGRAARSTLLGGALAALLGVAIPGAAEAADPIGQIKTAAGAVAIERDGARRPATPGDRVLPSDVVVTGADGSVGITFLDNSMMSLGPDSITVAARGKRELLVPTPDQTREPRNRRIEVTVR
jgi:hypothetical protein